MPAENIEQTLTKISTVLVPMIKNLIDYSIGKQYTFTSEEEFKAQHSNERQKIYWQEIIYRSHWAATGSLIRTKKWLDACFSAIESENYIAFCSSLRGLLESSADAYSALGAVPLTLAEASGHIKEALNGSNSKSLLISEELEDSLIHFIFARKLNKAELSPKSHSAKTASSIINELDSPSTPLKNLYSELCQVVHPAAQSISWLVESEGDTYSLTQPDEITLIKNLGQKYSSCIEEIITYPTNISIFIYKVINNLNIQNLKNPYADSLNMSASPLHNKIKVAFSKG